MSGDGDVRGEGEKERDQGSIDIAQLSVPEHCLEEVMSHDTHITKATAVTGSCDSHVTATDQSQPPDVNKETQPPVFEGTLILTPRRGSEPELDIERRDEYARRFTVLEGLGGGANISDSTHFTSPAQQRSEPIPIKVLYTLIIHVVLYTCVYSCQHICYTVYVLLKFPSTSVFTIVLTPLSLSPPPQSPREGNVHAVYSSLPDEMEIFSDSALDDVR